MHLSIDVITHNATVEYLLVLQYHCFDNKDVQHVQHVQQNIHELTYLNNQYYISSMPALQSRCKFIAFLFFMALNSSTSQLT